MTDEQKIDIPERHQAFCKAIAALAREHGLHKFSGSFRPGFGDDWHADISFSWEEGRHGEDANRIVIQSQFYVQTRVTGPSR